VLNRLSLAFASNECSAFEDAVGYDVMGFFLFSRSGDGVPAVMRSGCRENPY
jgi:hypothetical protein